ncbi:MAG TPA: hypothetical protein VLX44_22695 [Xanthobacteraceae bacterium]|nr:hypothetical protein [Xanthobacteraceae bacterium]
MARAIAHAIDAKVIKAPGGTIVFESASSHDNVVEVRYRTNDPAVFSQLKSNVDKIRSEKASYYCGAGPLAALKQGVVVHEVIASPDNAERLDFTFDTSTCAQLPRPTPADAQTLAGFALSAAKAENAMAAQSSPSAFHLSGAAALDGVVEERFTVQDPSGGANTRANSGKIAGVLKGYYCGKYHDLIARGLVFHQSFVLPDNTPVFELTIGHADC